MPYMVKIIYSVFLFTTLTVFGQSSLSVENEIYNSVDAFVANPSAESIKKLDTAEQNFWKNPKPKTKNELLALVVLNCNKAFYENTFGKTNKAISSYEKAWQIFQKHRLSNYDITEYCLKPLGNLYTIIGDYDNAENTIKQYYYIANTQRNEQQKIAAIINLSNVYQSNGKNKLAIELLENTIQTEKLTTTQKGNLLNNLGSNYILVNNNEQAKKALQKSIEFLKKDPSQFESVSNAYRNLTTIYKKERNYYLANTCLEEARKLFLKTGNSEPRKIAKLDYERSSLLFEQNKFVEASTLITAIFKTLIPNYSNQKGILPNRNSLYAETVLLDALDLQAQLFLKKNEPKKALEAYTLSFQIEDLIANLLFYENSKIINQIRIRNRTEKCISIYDYLYKKEKKIGYIESAFQLSERTK
jgi:tetratricopeptide (TPR) repeat protein